MDHTSCQKVSTWINSKSYFEKLRLAIERHRNDTITSHLTKVNAPNVLENFLEAIQQCPTYDATNIKSQVSVVLSKLELLKQTHSDNRTTPTIQNQEFEQSVRHRFDIFTSTITTSDGNIFFDFSKQSISGEIYIQLLQLVRLSNLDKLMEKLFRQSGYLN